MNLIGKQSTHCLIKSLPKDILNWFKLKAIADKINATENLKFLLGRVENIEGKGENACTSIFSFSLNVFKRPLIQSR